MAQLTPDRMCAHTAAAQFGVIGLVQALACGLTRDAVLQRVKKGRWVRVLPRVYRIGGAPETWAQRLMAAVLWAGTEAAVSFLAAAALWGFGGFPKEPIEISATRRLLRPTSRVIVHQPRRLLEGEITEVDGIPTTTPARTLIDLCGAVPVWRAERALDEALRRKLTFVPELLNYLRLEARQGRNGVTVFRNLLEARSGDYAPPDSELSRKLERLLLSPPLLPPPVRQHPRFHGHRLVRVYDLAYPEALLGIEGDSFKHHSDSFTWNKDRGKDNSDGPVGWFTLRYTMRDIDERPDEVIEEVRTTRLARLHLTERP